MVLVAGLAAPPLAFTNAYGAGLTDWWDAAYLSFN